MPASKLKPFSEYTLSNGSVWIKVNNLLVKVTATDEGAIADIYARGKEEEGPISSAYTFFAEAEGEDFFESEKL